MVDNGKRAKEKRWKGWRCYRSLTQRLQENEVFLIRPIKTPAARTNSVLPGPP